MESKKEKRQRRQAERDAKFEEMKASLVKRVVTGSQPIVQVDVQSDKKPHLPPHLSRAAIEKDKQPRVIKSGSRFSEKMTWCVSCSDNIGNWAWGELRAWEDHEWSGEINPKFLELSKLSWAEIDGFNSESGHKMHHGHELDDLTKEAQDRWFELDLGEFADDVFRFRLEGTKRAWGYILQAHFHLVWWERHHKIYPVS